MVEVHNDLVRRLLRPAYAPAEVDDILRLLEARGSLSFTPLPTGLYPAASLGAEAAAQSGYGNVWVRDNVYVALALQAAGADDKAGAALRALAAYFANHRGRLEDIVEGRADPAQPMNRPQVRFDGRALAEIPARWAQAQNDALGYFLWLYCRTARAGGLAPDGELLALFALYFRAIRFWQDEDNGHWEEARKIEASSIGAVVAGLRELRLLLVERRPPLSYRGAPVTPETVEGLIEEGARALEGILPAECVQTDPRKMRPYDAALLFLIYPLEVVDEAMGRRILDRVLEHLQGRHGVRRYLGDSYWTADYKEKLPRDERTADFSERQAERDALARPGEEAQWCIFDPIVSVIFGRRYMTSHEPADLERQAHHLNRSLGQLTGPDCPQGELLCPEAYYLEHGRYVPNDHVPLLWTQANLRLALAAMRASAEASSGR